MSEAKKVVTHQTWILRLASYHSQLSRQLLQIKFLVHLGRVLNKNINSRDLSREFPGPESPNAELTSMYFQHHFLNAHCDLTTIRQWSL